MEFQFRDVARGARDWWLVLTSEDADVCDYDPGYDVSVTVDAAAQPGGGVARRRRVAPGPALRAYGLTGPRAVRRALPRWFTLSDFAEVPRPATV